MKSAPTQIMQLGHEEFCPEGGPWLARQTFMRAETIWMSSMLGAYFPSLPRVLDILDEGTQINVMLGTAPGEVVRTYCSRVGPLPIGIACVLVWRLASELEAMESFLPEVVSYVDPLSCRVGLWQQDFLQLFVDRFESRPMGACGDCLKGDAGLFDADQRTSDGAHK